MGLMEKNTMKHRSCSWPDCPCGMGRWMGSSRCLAFNPTRWMRFIWWLERVGL